MNYSQNVCEREMQNKMQLEIRYYKVVLKEINFIFHNEKASVKMKKRFAFHKLYL